MWTMLRYVRPDVLQKFGVETFDDFVGSIDDEFMRDRTFEAKDVKNRLIEILHPSGSDWTAQLKEHIAQIL
jgi:hypothetical protein